MRRRVRRRLPFIFSVVDCLMTMNIQDCIALIVNDKKWIYEGSFIQEHPSVPANCNYGGFTGGLRERRYKFTVPRTLGFPETLNFSTREVRRQAKAIQRHYS